MSLEWTDGRHTNRALQKSPGPSHGWVSGFRLVFSSGEGAACVCQEETCITAGKVRSLQYCPWQRLCFLSVISFCFVCFPFLSLALLWSLMVLGMLLHFKAPSLFRCTAAAGFCACASPRVNTRLGFKETQSGEGPGGRAGTFLVISHGKGVGGGCGDDVSRAGDSNSLPVYAPVGSPGAECSSFPKPWAPL